MDSANSAAMVCLPGVRNESVPFRMSAENPESGDPGTAGYFAQPHSFATGSISSARPLT
jgi:hypothetical protein